MMNFWGYFFKQNIKKEMILITIVYFAAHWFMLITTGRWWDDWNMVDQPYSSLKDFSMELGRPSVIIIMTIAKALPESGYRIITFFMFYCCCLFLFRTLKEWLNLSNDTCLWICMLYAVIPANDARMMLAVFPYTISLFFYMLAMCYFYSRLCIKDIRLRDRVLCYLLFVVAFTTNSMLVFYGLIIMMIVVHNYMNHSLNEIIKYVDFFMLPIVFFITKNVLFPAYGALEGYNSVTVIGLLKGIINIIGTDILVLAQLGSNICNCDIKMQCIIFGVLVCVFILSNYKSIRIVLEEAVRARTVPSLSNDNISICENKSSVMRILLLGILALSLGLFAYVVVRGTPYIVTTGIEGRDSLLVAMGASMVIYSSVFLMFKTSVRKYVLAGVIMGSVIFFNTWYISYQTDYYRQMGFQYQLKKHTELLNVHNIVYRNNDPGLVNEQSFYALNGNSEIALGLDDKLIMAGFSGTFVLDYKFLDHIIESGTYHMDSYDSSYKKIDAIVDYTFDAGYKETIYLKILELFDYDVFEEKLHDATDMSVYLSGTEIFDSILIENGYKNAE